MRAFARTFCGREGQLGVGRAFTRGSIRRRRTHTGDDGEYLSIAPAYDIPSMRFAPIGAGVDPELAPIEPKVGTIGATLGVCATAAKAASRFWQAAQKEEFAAPTSAQMRALAPVNLDVAKRFVAPLLPASGAKLTVPARLESGGPAPSNHMPHARRPG